MSNKKIHIPHAKKRGEWAELRFLLRAVEYGLAIAKPFGDCSSYDFCIDRSGRLLRVQVKCTVRMFLAALESAHHRVPHFSRPSREVGESQPKLRLSRSVSDDP